MPESHVLGLQGSQSHKANAWVSGLGLGGSAYALRSRAEPRLVLVANHTKHTDDQAAMPVIVTVRSIPTTSTNAALNPKP